MTDVAVQDEPDNKTGTAVTGKDSALSGEVTFNQDIVIYAGNRLPQFDKGAAKAYAAHGIDNAPANLFALVCEDHLSPRTTNCTNYAAVLNPSLARLVGWGPIDWPMSGKQKFCLVFENTLGMPLKKDDAQGGLGMKQELVLAAVVRPIVNVLTDLRDKDLVHGCIRLANIYDGGSRTLERAVLGEGLSTPASSQMPALYEPIERAMASPTGRGPGKLSDDLYSFGVCIAIMLRSSDPLENMTDDQILEIKMEEGSYLALTGKDRFTGAILELLRGLLHDEEAERWTLDEVIEWLDGRRLSPKQAVRRLKASRPIIFNGHKYFRPEVLAKDLHKNPTEARQLVENGELDQWISRAMENKPMAERIDKAIQLSEEGGKGTGYTERLVTRLTMALYPEGPIRYKNINIMPDGVGTALTEAYVMKRDLQTYIDFFMIYFITQWVDVQPSSISDVSNLVSRFDGARAYLRQKAIGGGLERCIYALNEEVPCLSEKLSKYYVRTPEELMRTYEKLSHYPNRPAMMMDRHIVAFLAVKDRRNIDPYISELNAEEPYRRILAEIKVLATLQKRLQLERFPGIAGWIMENVEPLYSRFHDRELRTEIRKKAERLKDAGDLVKILTLFDSPAVYQEDNVGFRRAMRKYYDLETENADLERDLRDESKFGREFGKQIAAMVAGALAALIILATAFSAFGSGSQFF